jgi:hypothetical protein
VAMKTIIKAVIKIITLLFAIKLLSPLVSNIATTVIAYQENRQYALIYLVSALITIIVSALVLYFGWWKTDKIVRLIAGDLDENAIVVSTSNVDLYRVIISVLGIYLLATSIPGLISLISDHFYFARMGLTLDMVPNEIGRWTFQIVTFLLGIWLAIGSKPITKFFSSIWKQGGQVSNQN